MKSDVKRLGFERARESVGDVWLRGLLIALTSLTLVQTPVRAQAGEAAGVASSRNEAAKWERFTYPGEKFSVELPEMPFVFRTTRHVSRTLSDNETMRVFGILPREEGRQRGVAVRHFGI
ncbi:MAG TPA: hypothetical protein VFS10_04350 [Pyrinomonadaceae bacterium]|nr:hypothetical protein [Pyrinomonadaceae bacterium]